MKLVKAQTDVLSTSSWKAMRAQALELVKSGFLPESIKTPEQAMAVAIAGRELGVPMMQAFRAITVIHGQISASPQLMLALARRTKELEEFKVVGNDKSCTVTVKRKGMSPHTTTFTLQEASRMVSKEHGKTIPLTQKFNWRNMPKIMLQWRAVAANLRVTFPDAISGLHTPEELGGEVVFDEEGDVKDIQVETKNPKHEAPTFDKEPIDVGPEPAHPLDSLPPDNYNIPPKPKSKKKGGPSLFVLELQKLKDQMGEEKYREILKANGYKKSDEVPEDKDKGKESSVQVKIWREMKEAAYKAQTRLHGFLKAMHTESHRVGVEAFKKAMKELGHVKVEKFLGEEEQKKLLDSTSMLPDFDYEKHQAELFGETK